jgi:hypothetical protein
MTIKVTYNVTDVYVTQDVSPVYINVSYSDGGSGGASVWGGITGTLSDQTDLQNALNAKFDDPTGTTSQYLRGDGSLATFPAIPSGTVTSVGLTMPSAFSVANSPITSSGTLAVTGAGTSAQYIRGDGQLANFPSSGGGGSAYNYYLNGSVNQGTFGGDVYYEMSKTPVLGAGTNFTRTNGQGNGYIASFITDAGDPSLLNIPAGNWNLEFYFQSSASGGSPQFYAELYKVSSANVFTLIASGSTNPEGITNGTTIDQYFTSIPVPQTSLLVTDRLAVRIYVIPAGRTITLHTENSNLCEILTTFSTGLNALNGLTAQVQYFATGTSGTDFGISSATDTHTFNLPTASSINRGALSSADWTTFNNKVPASRTLTINGVAFDLSADRSWTVSGGISGSGASGQVAYWDGTTSQAGSNNLFWDNTNGRLGIGTNVPSADLSILKSSTATVQAYIKNSSTGLVADTRIVIANDASLEGGFFIGSSTRTLDASSVLVYANRQMRFMTNNLISTGGTDAIIFQAGGSNPSQEGMRVTGTKNILIGTTTDSGQRLQVQGTTLLNGNVTFSSATGMFWDATNSRLGIGTNAPATSAEIATSAARLRFNQTVGGSIFHGIEFATSGTVYASFLGNQNTGEVRLTTVASYFPTFYASGSEGMRLTTNRNLLIQNGGTFTDSGERLQVTGDVFIKGSGATSGTRALTVQNSSSQNILRVRNDGNILFGNSGNPIWAFTYSSVYDTIDINGTNLSIYPLSGSISLGGATQSQTSGNQNNVITKGRFQPTSGTATFTEIRSEPLINQTGGANGITRGLYVNPTLTAAADFRAIETTNGKVIFGNLPTSSAGLPTGAIWNDAGTIKIV